nr:hypothetical protein Iba_chr05eCG7350 [Ipomoea batatas]
MLAPPPRGSPLPPPSQFPRAPAALPSSYGCFLMHNLHLEPSGISQPELCQVQRVSQPVCFGHYPRRTEFCGGRFWQFLRPFRWQLQMVCRQRESWATLIQH